MDNYTQNQLNSIGYALQNFYVNSTTVSISASGGTSNTGQLYFETPFLVKQIKVSAFPSARTPTQVSSGSTNSVAFNQTLPAQELYTLNLQTKQNNFTYIGATNPAIADILNIEKYWWYVASTTYINAIVAHTAQLTTAVDTFPVKFYVHLIGYRLTDEIVKDPTNILGIIRALRD